MKKNELKNLLKEVQDKGYYKKSKKMFEGGGIIISKQPPIVESSHIYVISNYASEISALIFDLKNIFKNKLDYLNKYEFYECIANRANKYINENGDNLGVIEEIIKEAINLYTEWNRIYYFAYGSNMDNEQMNDRCPDSKFIRTVIIPDYKFALDCAGVATIVKNKGSKIQGVLWSITGEDMINLDRYEGISSGCYKKDSIIIPEVNCNEQKALVYISNRAIKAGDKRLGYMEKIINAAKNLYFEDNYIAELEEYNRI